MKLSDNRILLRAPEPSDLDFLFMLQSLDGIEGSGFDTAPVSRQQLWQYIDCYQADIFAQKELRLVIADSVTGERVGCVDISDYDCRDRRGFVGIIIAPAFRRRGYALAALEVLCAYASDTLGMHQLAAVVDCGNAASKALFAAAGFKSAGRLRSWLRRGRMYADALIFQRLFC